MSSKPFQLLAVFLSLALSACSSSPPEGAEDGGGGTSEPGADVGEGFEPVSAPASAPHPEDMTAEELEQELALTRPGQILLRALRAHGGWDVWRKTQRVRFRVQRASETPPESPATGDSPTAVERTEDVVLTGPASRSVGGRPSDEALAIGLTRDDHPLGEQFCLAAAPFCFVNRKLDAEYLGVEMEVASGQSFAKVKFSTRHAPPPFVCIAYFDATTKVLQRLLIPQEGRTFRLVVLSGWKPCDPESLLIARTRRFYALRKRFAHVDFDAPTLEESLMNVILEVKRPSEDADPSG